MLLLVGVGVQAVLLLVGVAPLVVDAGVLVVLLLVGAGILVVPLVVDAGVPVVLLLVVVVLPRVAAVARCAGADDKRPTAVAGKQLAVAAADRLVAAQGVVGAETTRSLRYQRMLPLQ